MKPGHYIIETKPTYQHSDGSVSHNIRPDRTIVEYDGSSSFQISWIGGESCSNIEEVLLNWNIISFIDIDAAVPDT